eukprot:1025182-Lingulodinium_polyedra.AAC.1
MVTLADQEKAFERMGHGWLRLVLRGWNAPEWSVNAAAALVTGRTVTSRVGGQLGPLRRLRRGIDTGGAAST